MIKKSICLFLSCILSISLVGCGLLPIYEDTNLEERPTLADISESGDYVLADKTGKIILCDKNGKVLDTFKIDSNKKSDFMFCVDNGTVYAAEVVGDAAEAQIIYALDKGNNRIYMLSIKSDKIKEIETKSVKDTNIDRIYAYNGTLFYSVISEKRSSNSYTYKKVASEEYNGVINYNASLPEPLPSKNKTYIITINFINEYLKEMGYNLFSSYSRDNMSLGPDSKSETYQIPCEVNYWIADGDNIYFFYDERMGQYNMKNNQIGLYYGPHMTFESDLQDGLNGSVYALSNFGDNSHKGLLYDLNLGDMTVKNIIEIDNPAGLELSVDRTGYICVAVKNNGDKYFSTLKIFNHDTLKEEHAVPFSYVPTDMFAHNGRAYMINDNEKYFIIVDLASGNYGEYEKVIDGINYDYILPVNSLKVDKYLYNANGHYQNEQGIEMLKDGTLVNDKGVKINRYFQTIDENGKAINSSGEFIDRYNNVIDENGNIIRYVPDADGYYRNSKGYYVNANGTLLKQDEEGNWIDPDIEIDEPITGHYDENGEFIIDADYLKRHPDAYDKLEKELEKGNVKSSNEKDSLFWN